MKVEAEQQQCGFWTIHEMEGRSAVDAARQPPGETELSGLARGTLHVDTSDGPTVWVLREVFDSYEAARAWMDETFEQLDWEEYLTTWNERNGG